MKKRSSKTVGGGKEGVRERNEVRHSGRKFGREREEIEQTHEGRVGPPIQDILQYIII